MKSLYKSFSHACRGMAYAFRHERNFRIQVVMGAVVIVVGMYWPLASWQRIILLLLVMTVLTLELVNTIFERIIDVVKPQLATYVREIKDLMSAAVLLASVFSLAIGLFIFWPHVLYFLS